MVVVLRATCLPEGGESLPLQIVTRGGKTVIGRGKKMADVVLVSKPNLVSRLHCSLISKEEAGAGASASAGASSGASSGGCRLLSGFCGTMCSKADSVLFVRDEGSVNGTFVNGAKIEARKCVGLQEGDVVSFSAAGKLKYRIATCSEEEAADFDKQDHAGLRAQLTVVEAPRAAAATADQVGAGASAGTSASPGRCGSMSWLCGGGSSSAAASSPAGTASPPPVSALKRARSSSGQGALSPRTSAMTGADVAGITGGGSFEALSLNGSASGTPGGGAAAISSPSSSPSKRDGCPFSSLIDMVKSHAKKLCVSNVCKGKEQELMAAATAACQVVAQQQKQQIQFQQQQVEVQQQQQQSAGAAECVKKLPCIPLTDDTVPAGCVALADPCRSNLSNCLGPEPPAFKGSAAAVEAFKKADKERSTLTKKMSELRSELTCPICQDPFLRTNTLECGHSFCEPCVSQWLSKCLSCPICRGQVTKPPTLSLTTDRIVEVTLRGSTNQGAWNALVAREAEYNDQLHALDCKKGELEGALSCAARKGLKLVQITKPWSEREQCRFVKGLRCYHGGPREAYCASVGLTEASVQSATMLELTTAARNVRLGKKDPTPCDYTLMDAVALRQRLLMFLRYC